MSSKGRKSRINVRSANIHELTSKFWQKIINDPYLPRGKFLQRISPSFKIFPSFSIVSLVLYTPYLTFPYFMPATISLCPNVPSIFAIHPLEFLILSPLARGRNRRSPHFVLLQYCRSLPKLVKNYPASLHAYWRQLAINQKLSQRCNLIA
jgi:hypothetical protein